MCQDPLINENIASEKSEWKTVTGNFGSKAVPCTLHLKADLVPILYHLASNRELERHRNCTKSTTTFYADSKINQFLC